MQAFTNLGGKSKESEDASTVFIINACNLPPDKVCYYTGACTCMFKLHVHVHVRTYILYIDAYFV